MNISSVCIYLPWPSPGRDVSETGSKYTRCLGQTQVDSVAAIRQANWLSLPVAAETERKRRRKRRRGRVLLSQAVMFGGGRKTGKERVVKTQLELKTVPWNVRATRPGSRKVRNPITLWFLAGSHGVTWSSWPHTLTRPLSFSSLLPTTQARNQN